MLLLVATSPWQQMAAAQLPWLHVRKASPEVEPETSHVEVMAHGMYSYPLVVLYYYIIHDIMFCKFPWYKKVFMVIKVYFISCPPFLWFVLLLNRSTMLSFILYYFILFIETCFHFSVACPSLALPTGGTLHYSTDGSVTQVMVECDLGYTLSGSKELTCRADGTWNLIAGKCSESPCSYFITS